MPCFFCIAALTVAATVIVPAVVDRTEENMRTAAADLRRVKDTSTMVMWTGTFRFTAPSGVERTAATNVTIYKDSKRARIQCLTHDLPHEEVHALQDAVAALVGASVMSRTDGDPALLRSSRHRDATVDQGLQLPAAEEGTAQRQPPQER